MRIKDITNYLEELAPLSSQESYDNCGLIVGDASADVKGILVSLDCIEEIVDEAIATGANLIVAHHPIVFKGLKKINGKNYIERTVLKAIKNDIAIYAIHTNYDNYQFGVNREIGERLQLENLTVLAPKRQVLTKLVCFVPEVNVDDVASAMYNAGAGTIGNYKECSFKSEGEGTFKPVEGANPAEGIVGELSKVQEVRLEVLVSNHVLGAVLQAMKSAHPYEEVAHEMYAIMNDNQSEGAGMVGDLPEEMSELEFLKKLKEVFKCGSIRHTALLNSKVKRVAYCGGAGSFLLSQAKASGADIFVTGDFKYHEFFDAENQIVIADIGHFESEQFTSNRLAAILTKKFPKFAVRLTEVNTNPINYF
ncbi:MAG: Nif3-like dinuclear metal center hexameric protein [Crocinitomicaceae bacterium]|nr:Nif3-like dinuclear metal center hexameric protein [Crocinitomicaceae bacterium]